MSIPQWSYVYRSSQEDETVIHKSYYIEKDKYEKLIARKTRKAAFTMG